MKIQIVKLILLMMLAQKLSGFFVEQNPQFNNDDSQINDPPGEDNYNLGSPPQLPTLQVLPPNLNPVPNPISYNPSQNSNQNSDDSSKGNQVINKITNGIFSFALPAIQKIGDGIINRLDNLVAKMKDKSKNHKEKLKKCASLFENFKARFNKKFKSDDSEAHGFENFEQNNDFIEDCNTKKKRPFRLGHNEYSHLAWEEFQDRFLMKDTDKFKDNNYLQKKLRENPSRSSFYRAKAPVVGNSFTDYSHRRLLQSENPTQFAQSIGVPTSVNWRQFVTPVKNQKRCNSCYAFAGTGALEAAIAKRYGSTSVLSEQEQIDCSSWDLGCSGGDPFNSLMYHMYYGTAKQADYPYVANKTTCKFLNSDQKIYTPVNARYISGDVASFLQALAEGPVSVIHEVNRDFSLYVSGVYNQLKCGTSLNHSAVAYGYNLLDPIPHILVKNAWGTTWGESGHYKLAIGPLTGANRGGCGFLSHDYTSMPYY